MMNRRNLLALLSTSLIATGVLPAYAQQGAVTIHYPSALHSF